MTTVGRFASERKRRSVLQVGPRGLPGQTGATGPQGPAGALSPRMPSEYAELASPFSTTAAVLEDVTGVAKIITLTVPAYIAVSASFELQTQSGGSSSTIAIALNIDGTDYDEYSRYLSGANDQGIGAINHRTSVEVSPGAHTVKLRCRRVSGVATPGINHADMLVWAL